MNKFINIGFGNLINVDKIVTVTSPEAAPIKRMVQAAKDNGNAVDATCGRRTKSVIVTDSGHVVLAAITSETIINRVNNEKNNEQKD